MSDSMYSLGKSLYDIGELMIVDDASDIGYFDYYGRSSHYYHGVHSPNHPSPFHHYQVGGIVSLLGQIIGLLAVANKMNEPDDDELELSPQSALPSI